MPPAGCDASGKAEKNGNGENSFSPVPFFCFHCARGEKILFPHVSCGSKIAESANPFASRSPEEELLWRGVQGARSPLLYSSAIKDLLGIKLISEKKKYPVWLSWRGAGRDSLAPKNLSPLYLPILNPAV